MIDKHVKHIYQTVLTLTCNGTRLRCTNRFASSKEKRTEQGRIKGELDSCCRHQGCNRRAVKDSVLRLHWNTTRQRQESTTGYSRTIAFPLFFSTLLYNPQFWTLMFILDTTFMDEVISLAISKVYVISQTTQSLLTGM